MSEPWGASRSKGSSEAYLSEQTAFAGQVGDMLAAIGLTLQGRMSAQLRDEAAIAASLIADLEATWTDVKAEASLRVLVEEDATKLQGDLLQKGKELESSKASMTWLEGTLARKWS